MRFLHTADWHVGKKFNGYDLLADQGKILDQITAIALREKVEAVVIAGDLYDRTVPPVEAVALLNQKIQHLNLQEQLPVLAISGNHDSGTRLATGSPWYTQTDFYLHTNLEQAFTPVVLGDTQFFLLPYFEPIAARLYFDEEVRSIQEAMELVIAKIKSAFDPQLRHVLVTHFFVAGSLRSDSETKIEVGGLDSVPAELLDDFDYVALGHLHGRNALQHPTIQYSGSPLKFSLSEAHQEKGVFLVDTTAGTRHFIPLVPEHEVRILEASYEELLDPAFYQNQQREDFLQIKLTNRGVIPNLMNTLRGIYPRLLGLERTAGIERSTEIKQTESQSPEQVMADFFYEMTQEKLTKQQSQWLEDSLGAQNQE